jgi:putative aldouronate transport system permease protein
MIGRATAKTPANALRKTPSNNLWLNFLKHWQLYAIIAIPLLYIIIFHYVPMGGIIIAFKKYRVTKGMFGSDWVGLKWFLKFLGLQ